jgi:hypothetical protein
MQTKETITIAAVSVTRTKDRRLFRIWRMRELVELLVKLDRNVVL